MLRAILVNLNLLIPRELAMADLKLIRYLIILLILCFKTLPSNGQGFSFVKNYSPKDYKVGGEQIRSIAQDSNKVIYFATNDNVLFFDGVSWDSFHIGESGSVSVIKNLENGEIIAGGNNELGYIIEDNINSLTYRSINPIHDRNTTYWEVHDYKEKAIARNFYSLDIISGGTIDYFRKEGLSRSFKIGDSLIVDLFEDGLYYYENGKLKKVAGSDFLKGKQVSFATKIDGALIIAAPDTGFFIKSGIVFKPIFQEASNFIKENGLYAFLKLKDGNYALATERNGLALMSRNGDILSVLNQSNGLQSNKVFAIHEIDDGIIWLGLDRGISKVQYNSKLGKTYSKYLLDTSSVGILEIQNGLWVSTKKGLLKGEKNKYGSYSFMEVPTISGYSKLQEFNSEILVGDTQGLLSLRKNENNNLMSSSITSMSVSENTLIVSTGQDILTFDEGLTLIDSIHTGIYFENSIEYQKEYFFYSLDKIYKISKDQDRQELPIISDHPDKRINALGQIGGELYLGVNSGLYKYNSMTESFFKDSVFFRDQKQVFAFEQCSKNEIWFNHDKKIKKAVFSYGELSIESGFYSHIGEGEDVFTISCSKEKVWFAGEEGVYYFDDSNEYFKTDFKTNITGIYVQNDSLIYGGFGEPVKPIVLPYEDNEMRFTYAAASYIDETRNTYSYKLEGFDNNWSPWSLETQKDYTNLPEGDYVFKVKSRNVYEVDGRMDQLSFSILPPWYRTWWAYFMYTILITGILYTAFKIRVNQILKVERMRTQIANDLHDDVSATLTGISLYAAAVQRDKDPKKKSYFMNRITESAGDAKENITDIVWAINPENDQWDEFLVKCRRYASDLMESKEIEYTLHIADQIPGKLKMDIRQHLWMIFKEMLTNVVRHSKAERVDIILDVEDGILKLIFQDNGVGIEKGRETGNGLLNIKNRAEKIKGKLVLETDKEFGTRWRLELPL